MDGQIFCSLIGMTPDARRPRPRASPTPPALTHRGPYRSRPMNHAFRTVRLVLTLLACAVSPVHVEPFPVSIRVDASKDAGPLKPIWRFFGADEPNYAYMKDGEKLLRELGELQPKSVYFRTHNLLTSGD